MNGTDQGMKISARQICPARTFHKKGVPGKKAVVDMQADRAGCMSRRMDHLYLEGSHGKNIIVMKGDINVICLPGFRRLGCRPVLEKGFIIHMHAHGYVIVGGYGDIGLHMVTVAMGVDEVSGMDVMVLYDAMDLFILSPGINNNALQCFGAGNDIRVDFIGTDIQSLNEQRVALHGILFIFRSMPGFLSVE